MDWILSTLAVALMVALSFGAHTLTHVLEGCLAVTRRRGQLWGLALFFFLLVGVPVLVVVWGYATGRLPAALPYVD